MATNQINLPEGFVLETKQPTNLNLPQGFVLEQPKKKGLITGLIEEPEKKIPFSTAGVMESIEVAGAARRIQSGAGVGEGEYKLTATQPSYVPLGNMPYMMPVIGAQATPESDRGLLQSFIKKQRDLDWKNYTFAGKVGKAVSILPAWMIEFAMTGGTKQIASKATEKFLENRVKSEVVKKLAGWAVGAGARATYMPHRVGVALAQRRQPDMDFDPDGNLVIGDVPKENWATSLAKAWGSVWIETASEEAGETLVKYGSKILQKLPFGQRFVNGLYNIWQKIRPTGTVAEFTEQLFKKGGYSSYIGEVGEERLATLMHAIAGTQDFGAGPDAGIIDRLKAGLKSDWEGLPVEAVTLAVPGAVKLFVPGAARLMDSERPVKIINDIEDARTIINEHPDLTPEEKEVGLKYIGDIETKTITSIIDKFPGEIESQEQLEQIGNQIKDYLGIDENIFWKWSERKVTRQLGTSFANGKIIIYSKHPQHIGNQNEIKTTIVHELGHVIQELKFSETGRRKLHTPEFNDWVKENIKKLTEETQRVEPIHREEAVGPVGTQIIELKPGEIYRGPAYRTETGFEPKGTAADVIRFEQDELGNDYGVTGEQLKELEKRPASDITWVGRTKEDVARYGVETEREPTPEEIQNIPDDISEIVKGGKIIATDGEGGYLVLKPSPPSVTKEIKPKRISRKRALALGHKLPELLGWSDTQRLDFNKKMTGKPSMKNMTLPEMRTVVDAIQKEVTKAGLEYKPEEKPAEPFIEVLRTRKVTEETPIKALSRGRVRQLAYDFKRGMYSFLVGQERMARFLERLDGKPDGLFYNKIWLPLKEADELANQFGANDQFKLVEFLKENNVDPDVWMGKFDIVPGTNIKLSTSQRIGVYAHSLNKKGLNYLIKGMGFSESDISSVKKSLTPEELKVANFILDQFKTQWEPLRLVAIKSGFDPLKLKTEEWYFPIVRTDVELEQQEDFLAELADQFTAESLKPEAGMLKTRTPGAFGRLELDAFILYMHNSARINRFMSMAPVTSKIQKVLNNREFKRELNTRTYNQGSRLLNTWMKDSVRGHSNQQVSWLGKAVNLMRRKAISYAIGFNILSAGKQTLALNSSMAVDPLMWKYVPINVASTITPGQQNTLDDFVYERSLQMKQREPERDLRRLYNSAMLKKMIRGKRLSPISMAMFKWMDRRVANLAWKSLYDVGMEKFKGNEDNAIKYADEWASKTQAMVSEKDLPQFFRGGVLEKLITTFQTELNTLGNFWAHDIVQAKARGEINWRMVSYRVLQSYVLPALIYGILGRGRLPKPKDVAVDLLTYGVAPFLLIGRWITAAIEGFGNTSEISETGPAAGVSFIQAVKRGSPRAIVKSAAIMIGALTGKITAQEIRTVEGIYDLVTEKTEDIRRVVYSKWALQQGLNKGEYKEKYEESGYAR